MSAPSPRGPRLREHGLRIGRFETGPANAITDVTGVAVGHGTVWRDEPEPPDGRGVARTGVSAIVPSAAESLVRQPVAAGGAILNGAGEMTGFVEISEWGLIETPIYLTSTHAVGRIYDGAVATAVASDPSVGVDNVVIPIVAECDDSWLSEARVVQVEAADAGRAVDAATGGAVAEGAVGAGTGMTALGWKAGIGTSSRRVPAGGAVVGVLVLANFGTGENLRIDGVPVGRLLPPDDEPGRPPAGSCIAVVAVDAPVSTHDLSRVARRVGLGLARTGSVAHHGSGEIFVAFSSGSTHTPSRAGRDLDDVFEAVVDATEEAVLNALWAAPEVVGREGRVSRALPHSPVLDLLREHGRLTS